MRYETLVDDPEGELKRICVLGIDFDESMLRHHERKASGFEVEKSWKELTMKPIDKARQGRYRAKPVTPGDPPDRADRRAHARAVRYTPDQTIGDARCGG